MKCHSESCDESSVSDKHIYCLFFFLFSKNLSAASLSLSLVSFEIEGGVLLA